MSNNENKKTVTFMSKHRSLSIGLISSYYKVEDGLKTLSPGIRANFEDNVYQTDDEKIIKLMRANRHNIANGGGLFQEVNNVAHQELAARVDALGYGDPDKKAAILKNEDEARAETEGKVAKQESGPKEKTKAKSKPKF